MFKLPTFHLCLETDSLKIMKKPSEQQQVLHTNISGLSKVGILGDLNDKTLKAQTGASICSYDGI